MDLRYALLLGCFLLSGFAALLYETAWIRELSFVFGTSELAVAAVLAAYMGGLALGAAVAERLAPRLRRPVLAYGCLELGIAVSALCVPLGIRGLDAIFSAWLGGHAELPETGPALALLQLLSAFAVLLPPTAFMGATLPLLARHAVRREEQIALRVGVLYAVNTAGAIGGTLCAAFWLIPELGLRRTVWTGAAINGLVFALAVLLARGAPLPPEPAPRREPPPVGGVWFSVAIALSGAVAFVYEVLWTRLLGHLLGGSLHAFATMLASFLLGIALGSAVAARLATTRARAWVGFALAQLGIALTSYASFAVAGELPALREALGAGPMAPGASAALAVCVLLPITLCVGATFPFAVRALAVRPEQAAAVTARLYACTTVGAVIGSLGAGFVLLPHLGFDGTLAVGVIANLLLAAATSLLGTSWRPLAFLAAALAMGVALVPPSEPKRLLRHGPLQVSAEGGELIFQAVGRSSTVLLLDQGIRFRLSTNGLPESIVYRTGVLPPTPSIAHWLGLLPALVRPEARDLLMVGLGGGVALEAVPSSVERIDVIELEPEVLAANRHMAELRARDPLADPRVRVHLGDARGLLQLTDKRYDAIVSQPSHPWTAGASHLYTREFFELVRSRLAPDGVFVQWIGLLFVNEPLLRSLLAGLIDAFGHVELYSLGEGGLLFAASPQPVEGLAGAARALRAAPADFVPYGLHRLEDFASFWALDEEGTRALAEGAPPNSDDRNLLAAGAARIGSASLDAGSARALFEPMDPLRDPREELDRGALIRSLILTAQGERANRLAREGDELAAALGQGWMNLENRQRRTAARHFERARALAPDSLEALVGLVGSQRAELERGPLPALSDAELGDADARLQALVESWRAAARGDWRAVAEREPSLVRIDAAHPLFRDASRLRVLWRLELGDQAAKAEAADLAAESLLSSLWLPGDALLHARAAIEAGRPGAAWGSLFRLARRAPRNERGREFARRGLELARALPEELRSQVQPQLERRASASSDR